MSDPTPHTAGPWTLEYDGSVVMGGEIVLRPLGPEGSSRAEKLANNRLIAAAPDLLAAAKMALSAIGSDQIQIAAAESALEATIAKATSEEIKS